MKNTANVITRRVALAGAATAMLARPGLIRAQTSSDPIKIGVLNDVAGPYRNVGGLGSKVAAEMALEDIGGSLLGRPVQIVQADIQNKPDLASAKAREWIDAGFSLLLDGAATSSGLAIQEVARTKPAIFLGNGPIASDLSGKYCSPHGFHFCADAYALAKGTGTVLTKAGGTTWFFITADYQFGYSLQANTETFIKAAGGQVLGSVKAPLGTTDFSSALLQAKTSGAKVVAFANAGTDLQNCIKQASEFGLVKDGQSLATLLMFVTDVAVLGQAVCEGLVLTNSFYWDLTPQTRAWTARFAKQIDLPPTMIQVANYSSTLHWMHAVQAVGSLDTDAIAAKMRSTPVNDFCHTNVPISANGQLQVPVTVWRVKPVAQAKHKWDFYEPIATIPGDAAFTPLAETGCKI